MVRPVARFLRLEAASGIVLLAASVVALVWANGPWQAAYEQLWHTELGLEIGGWSIHHSLHHWVNDGLMAIFFAVVGLEQAMHTWSAFVILPLFALANAGVRISGDGWTRSFTACSRSRSPC